MTAHPVSKSKIRKRLGCGCLYIDVHQTDDGRMKRCPICHRLSVIHVRRAIYTDGWCADVEVVLEHVPSVGARHATEAPSSVDRAVPPARVPVTARQGSRQAGAAPAAHHFDHKGDAA